MSNLFSQSCPRDQAMSEYHDGHILNLTDRTDALLASKKEPFPSWLGEAGRLWPVYESLHKTQLQNPACESATRSQVCPLKCDASLAKMVSQSLASPFWPPRIHRSPINNNGRWWPDHYFHRASTCTGCLPWWIFVKKQNTTFIEINKRLRWQSDLLTIKEAHFSLTSAIATRKDVFSPWVFRKVVRSQGSFIKSKEND